MAVSITRQFYPSSATRGPGPRWPNISESIRKFRRASIIQTQLQVRVRPPREQLPRKPRRNGTIAGADAQAFEERYCYVESQTEEADGWSAKSPPQGADIHWARLQIARDGGLDGIESWLARRSAPSRLGQGRGRREGRNLTPSSLLDATQREAVIAPASWEAVRF